MNAAAAPVWRQLMPLTLAVLAAHAVLLRMHAQGLVQPGADAVRGFVTRTIAVPLSTPAAVSTASVATPAPLQRPADTPRPPAAARPAPRETLPALQAAAPESMPTSSGESTGPAPAAEPTAASTAPPSSQFTIPAPARLRYDVVAEVRGIPVQGNAELEWRHDGNEYEAKLSLHGLLFPRREQRSSGRITPEGLAPKAFYDKSRGEQATHFDREGGRVIFSNNRPEAPLAAGAQDRLSVMLQLAALVGGQPARYPPGAQIAVPTASTREAETWFFDVIAEEDLALPGGAVRALKLQRKPRKEFDQQIELWLAPRMDYAPVRLRLTNPNGDTVDHRWSSTDRG
ncbi:DUF3108 domain-containing protein [Caenimonas sedimenti]|nr:DUF3108 domain-containing protein [Caenimonas sedimenti]